MSEKIAYNTCSDQDLEPLLKMSQKLWKDVAKDKLEKLLKQALQSERHKILTAQNQKEQYVGFSVFSVRNDYVEGAEKTPTGYLEGIFVERKFRKMGIAREFIRLGEKWCKECGCSQLGSDTWLSDTASRKFHNSVGFWEEDELVHFLKNIP